MKKNTLAFSLVFIICFTDISYGQTQLNCTDLWNRSRIWNFGLNAGLDFNYNPPNILTNSAMAAMEGCSSISDISGSLMFYTNGANVWNGTTSTVITSGLLGGGSSSTQAAMILPMPGNASKYYIFTTDEFSHGYFYYSIVDSSGAIVPPDSLNKNIKLDTLEIVSEKLTAVRHSNKRDFWVISHEAHTGKFLIYLVDTSGVHTWSKPAIGMIYGGWSESPGYIRATCDGSKLAAATYNGKTVEIYDFNKSLGILSNLQHIAFSDATYGLEFSPNKLFLYVGLEATMGNPNIAQINISNNLVTPIKIATAPYPLRGALQLGPDGKIYGSRLGGLTYLCMIADPDLPGLACNYIDSAFSLNGHATADGFPNMPWTSGCCYCTNTSTNNPQTICPGEAYSLNSHTYSTDGTYYDTLQTVNSCDSIIITNLNFYPHISAGAGANVTIDHDTTVVLTATGGISYLWSTGATTSTIIVSPANTTTYTVTITDTNNCSSVATVTVSVDENCVYYLPNVFSPNGDGINDVLYLRGRGIDYFTLRIYDRWGEKVFETSDLKTGWDGTFRTKPMDQAVFVYYLTGRCKNGFDFAKHGNITLIK